MWMTKVTFQPSIYRLKIISFQNEGHCNFSGNVVPTISITKSKVIEDDKGEKDLWVTESNKKKIPILMATRNMLSSETGQNVRALPETIIQPSPITFRNPGNFKFRTGELNTQQNRIEMTQICYIRVTAGVLAQLRG